MLRYCSAKTVEPLLLVVDVIDMQCVRLTVGWIHRAHTENVLSLKDNEKSKVYEILKIKINVKA